MTALCILVDILVCNLCYCDNAGSGYVGDLDEYHFSTAKWERHTALHGPSARYSAVCMIPPHDDTRIFVINGNGSGVKEDGLFEYSFILKSWNHYSNTESYSKTSCLFFVQPNQLWLVRMCAGNACDMACTEVTPSIVQIPTKLYSQVAKAHYVDIAFQFK